MHSCPRCGRACYCSGDFEDHDTGPEYLDECECCEGPDSERDDFDDEDDETNCA